MATQTITWFSETTGFTRETCKRRLDAAGLEFTPGPHGAALYETPSALAAIYQQPANNQAALAAAQSANCPAAVEGAARNLIFEALENISAYDPADYAAEPAQPDR